MQLQSPTTSGVPLMLHVSPLRQERLQPPRCTVNSQTKILMVRPGADKQTMYLKVLGDDPGMIEIIGDMLEI